MLALNVDVDPCLATGEALRGSWRPLTSSAERHRFSQIMELMDDRYRGMELALARWLQPKADRQQAEIFGWFPDDNPQAMMQVVGITSRQTDDDRRVDLTLRRVGVAADLIPASDCDDAHIRHWLARCTRLMLELGMAGENIRAMRPKTMTWKPMERLHDYLREGLVLNVGNGSKPMLYRVSVIEERDRGDALHWIIRIQKCEDVVAPIEI